MRIGQKMWIFINGKFFNVSRFLYLKVPACLSICQRKSFIGSYNDHMLFSFKIIKSASLLIFPSFHVCVCKSITLQGFITFIVPGTSSEQCYSQDIPAKPGFLVTNIQVFINVLLVFKNFFIRLFGPTRLF